MGEDECGCVFMASIHTLHSFHSYSTFVNLHRLAYCGKITSLPPTIHCFQPHSTLSRSVNFPLSVSFIDPTGISSFLSLAVFQLKLSVPPIKMQCWVIHFLEHPKHCTSRNPILLRSFLLTGHSSPPLCSISANNGVFPVKSLFPTTIVWFRH